MDAKILFQLNEAYRHDVYNQIDEEVLSEEELLDIQEWVEVLIDEGYDLDQYTDEELYEAYLAEELTGSRATRAVKKDAELMRRIQSGDKTPELRAKRHDIHKLLEPSDDRTSFGRGNKALRRMGYTPTEGGTFFNPFNEEFDLYDLVSEYLVSEGFCDSYEDADVIMANMSEDWRDEIIEATVMSVTSPSGTKRTLNFAKAAPSKNLETPERLAAIRDINQQRVNRRAPEIEKRLKRRYNIPIKP